MPITREQIEEFKKAFRKDEMPESGVFIKTRWTEPDGCVSFMKTQTSLAPIVDALDQFIDDMTFGSLKLIFDAIENLNDAKKQKYEETLDNLVESLDSMLVAGEPALAIRFDQFLWAENPVVQRIVNDKDVWRPGEVVVTDLSRFPGCVAPTEDGERAREAAAEFGSNFDPRRYLAPTITKPIDSQSFLSLWEKRKHDVKKGKEPTSECSNFSYDAVAECLLDDNIRAKYDILQAGTMKNKHNIAILIPKGKGGGTYPGGMTPLPRGSLIVDPWARAMGYPAELTLFVTPRCFCYRKSLYPLDVNYYSTDVPSSDPSLDATVKGFKIKHALKSFLRKADNFMETDANSVGETTDISDELSELVKKFIGLEQSDTVVRVHINRLASTFEVEYIKNGTTHTIDEDQLVAKFMS